MHCRHGLQVTDCGMSLVMSFSSVREEVYITYDS